jgi:hypothetical protein
MAILGSQKYSKSCIIIRVNFLIYMPRSGILGIYSPMMNNIKQQIRQVTALDLRSLALMRVGMGLLLMLDVFRRMRDLSAHYTDYGILSRELLLKLEWDIGTYSLAMISGELWFISLLFLLTAFFSLMIILGYRTRLFTALGWFFLASIQLRNPVILNSGDAIFRLMLFWSMFLPLGARYSIDSALSPNNDHKKTNSVNHLGTFGFIYQLLIMYLITAVLKKSDIWLQDYSALHYAFNMQAHATAFGQWLLNFPNFNKFLTAVALYAEYLIPILFFVPFFHKQIRYFSIATFVGFHLVLVFTFYLGLFPWTCIFYWLALLPGSFWDFLDTKISVTKGRGQTVYYDRDCGFCRKSVFMIREFLNLKHLEIKQVQSEDRINNESEKYNSWIFDDGSTLFNRYSVFPELIGHSPIFFCSKKIFSSAPMRLFGSKVYHFVSHNRKIASNSTKFINVDKPINLDISKLAKAIGIYSIIVITLWNVRTTDFDYWRPKITKDFNKFAYALRITQYWTMFAPYPTTHDGWYTFPGKLLNGKEVDAFRIGEEHTFDKPENLYDSYIHQRWRKYLLTIWLRKKKKHRLHFARYLCRRWNDLHSGDEQLSTFKIYYMRRKTAAPGQPENAYKKDQIWSHNCFK